MALAPGFARPFPHLAIPGFLGPELSGRLLDHAISNETGFHSARVDNYGRVGARDTAVRVARVNADLGEFGAMFEDRIGALSASLAERLGVNAFVPARIETEMAAHGDGAFFSRHVDHAPGRTERMISAVYYLHRQPRRFTGGALRLEALVPDSTGPQHCDIEPAHDLLVAFSSWAPHRVLPISCPSHDFADSRFAVNCWLHRNRDGLTEGAQA